MYERILFPTDGTDAVEAVLDYVLDVAEEHDVAHRHPPESILVPTDGSEAADVATGEALELAAAMGATVHLLTVINPAILGYDVHSAMQANVLEDEAESILDDAAEMAAGTGIDDPVRTTEFGSPRETIVNYAKEEPSLIAKRAQDKGVFRPKTTRMRVLNTAVSPSKELLFSSDRSRDRQNPMFSPLTPPIALLSPPNR